MTRFQAEYVDAQGVPRSEAIEAESRTAALETLGPNRPWLRSLRGEAPCEGLAAVAGSLATCVERGVPLTPALRQVAQTASTSALRESLAKAAALTEEGRPLAEALQATGGPLAEPAFVELVRAGEGSDALGAALNEVAALAGRLERARAVVLERLTYPAFLLGSAALLVGAVVSTSGPMARSLVEFLASTEWRTPLFLQLLATASEAQGLVWALAVAVCLGVAGFLSRAHRLSPYRPTGLMGQPARDALRLRLLSALIARQIPLATAWSTLRCSLGGDLGDPAHAGLPEGQDAPVSFRAAGVVSPAEELGLEAAQRAGPDALAAQLEAIASDREARAQRRAERIGLWIELGVEVGVGLVLLVVALATLPSGYGVGR